MVSSNDTSILITTKTPKRKKEIQDTDKNKFVNSCQNHRNSTVLCRIHCVAFLNSKRDTTYINP